MHKIEAEERIQLLDAQGVDDLGKVAKEVRKLLARIDKSHELRNQINLLTSVTREPAQARSIFYKKPLRDLQAHLRTFLEDVNK